MSHNGPKSLENTEYEGNKTYNTRLDTLVLTKTAKSRNEPNAIL